MNILYSHPLVPFCVFIILHLEDIQNSYIIMLSLNYSLNDDELQKMVGRYKQCILAIPWMISESYNMKHNLHHGIEVKSFSLLYSFFYISDLHHQIMSLSRVCVKKYPCVFLGWPSFLLQPYDLFPYDQKYSHVVQAVDATGKICILKWKTNFSNKYICIVWNKTYISAEISK